MTILVTGGAGFIGSHFVRRAVRQGPGCEPFARGCEPFERVVVLDKLTYAGSLENLKDIESAPGGVFKFYKGDICDKALVDKIIRKEGVEAIVNFAAETHVDRSIMEPAAFLETDVKGVYVLLEAAKDITKGSQPLAKGSQPLRCFLQVSTDEVYGSISQGSFKETDTLHPSSPYSASKAAGELLAASYWATYGLPVIIARPCNTYGPYQYPEKLIPLFVTNALEDKKLPLYGDGGQVRDWLHVDDHCEALELLMQYGSPGQVYNIAAGNETTNLEITRIILEELGKPQTLIEHVKDREGHDRRYSLDFKKITELGWRPKVPFEKGLRDTIHWYADNPSWWRRLKKGRFLDYYNKQYAHRA